MEETLRLAREEECQMRREAETKSLELSVADDEVDVKSKALVDLVAWWRDGVTEAWAGYAKYAVFPNPDSWMDNAWDCI